jgi:hypothetical protein
VISMSDDGELAAEEAAMHLVDDVDTADDDTDDDTADDDPVD